VRVNPQAIGPLNAGEPRPGLIGQNTHAAVSAIDVEPETFLPAYIGDLVQGSIVPVLTVPALATTQTGAARPGGQLFQAAAQLIDVQPEV
jgi:hypothetical protein